MLEGKKQIDPTKHPCAPSASLNVYLAFLYPNIAKETAIRSDIFRIIEHYLSNCKKKWGNSRLARLYLCKTIKA
jgi:hypothetical protein